MLTALTVTDHVATLTLDSQPNRNALSRELIGSLTESIRHLSADDSVRIIVVTHAGPVFCAGVDLRDSTDGGVLPVTLLPELFQAIVEAPKPVVTKISGATRGGGMGLVAASDIAIASTKASFAFSEVRLGVVAAVVNPVVRARLTPRAAGEYLMTGATFDAHRAAEIGLVSRACTPESLDETMTSVTDELLQGAPEALQGVKQLLTADINPDWSKLTELSARHFHSEEAREGIAAFKAKRKPSWAPLPH